MYHFAKKNKPYTFTSIYICRISFPRLMRLKCAHTTHTHARTHPTIFKSKGFRFSVKLNAISNS